MNGKKMPVVIVLATGGTIAGRSSSRSESREYASGVFTINTLLKDIPELRKIAAIREEQICNIGSEDMTDGVWLELAAVAEDHLRDPEVEGIVILHGTDTMEETAYFLHLVIDSDKPIVLTGAMRPANVIGADGPANILDAIRLAASPEAKSMGVLVCLNGAISAARDVTKTNAASLAAFGTPVLGELGLMIDGKPALYRTPLRKKGGFRLDGIQTELPRVEILYGHAGQRRELVDAAIAAGARGIVHAGVGMGMIHRDVRAILVEAVKKGVVVVCSSRIAAGPTPISETMTRDGFIAAGSLNPQKARVLLQLALTVTAVPCRIQEIFDRF